MNKCDKCVHNGICTRQRYWSNGFESDKDKIENCDAFLPDFTCKPRTNYDKITSSEESLAEFIIFVVNESKNQRRLVSKILKDKNGKSELEKTIKEWLQKECDDGK